VASHIPPYSGSRGRGAQYITEHWGPILNQAQVDLMIGGHEHWLSYIKPVEEKNHFPVLVLGQDMILQVDVSPNRLDLSIKDKEGKEIQLSSISAKHVH